MKDITKPVDNPMTGKATVATGLSRELSELSKTALGVVYFRVTYGGLLKEPVRDPLGRKLLDALEYKPAENITSRPMLVLAPLRTRILDRLVSEFIKENGAGALIVNLGCGLCTRYERLLADGKLDPKNVTWISVDLRPMIDLRTFLWANLSTDTSGRQIQIPSSIFEDGCIKAVKECGNRPTLFIAEGVLGYFEPPAVKAFFEMLRDNFNGATILHTTIHPLRKEAQKDYPPSRPRHKWFINNGKEVEQMTSGLRLLKEVPFFDKTMLNPELLSPEILVVIDSHPQNYSSAVLLRIG